MAAESGSWGPCRACGEVDASKVHWADEGLMVEHALVTDRETGQTRQPYRKSALMSCDSCGVSRREEVERGWMHHPR